MSISYHVYSFDASEEAAAASEVLLGVSMGGMERDSLDLIDGFDSFSGRFRHDRCVGGLFDAVSAILHEAGGPIAEAAGALLVHLSSDRGRLVDSEDLPVNGYLTFEETVQLLSLLRRSATPGDDDEAAEVRGAVRVLERAVGQDLGVVVIRA